MPTDLPTTATIYYNGVTMGSLVDSQVLARPVEDEAKRATIAVAYLFSLRFPIFSGGGGGATTDAQIAALRSVLMTPGGEFRYEGVGFATSFHVNTPGGGGLRDVAWGPKPESFAYDPTGSDQSAFIDYKILVTVPECPDGINAAQALSFCYRVSWAFDAGGYGTRTYGGTVMVPLTRISVSNRTLPNNADTFRELVTPRVPTGYRRETRDFELSEDRRTLRFNVVDVQMAAPLPRNVVSAEFSHTAEAKVGLRMWTGTFRGRYEMALGYSGAEAAEPFFALVRARLDHVVGALLAQNGPGQEFDQTVIPIAFRMTEPDAYGRPAAEFSLTYTYTLPLPALAIATSALWRPGPGSDFGVWAQSMEQAKVSTPRGLSEFRYQSGDDLIVDLCLAGPMGQLRTAGNIPNIPGPNRQPGIPPYLRTAPPPDDSWVQYELKVTIEQTDETYELKPLPPAGGTPPGPLQRVVTPPSTMQQRVQPTTHMILQGRAIRAGYDIPAPALRRVGSLTPVPANVAGSNGFSTGVIATVGVPLTWAKWSLRYLLPEPPATTPAPVNPMLGGIDAQTYGYGPEYGMTGTTGV